MDTGPGADGVGGGGASRWPAASSTPISVRSSSGSDASPALAHRHSGLLRAVLQHGGMSSTPVDGPTLSPPPAALSSTYDDGEQDSSAASSSGACPAAAADVSRDEQAAVDTSAESAAAGAKADLADGAQNATLQSANCAPAERSWASVPSAVGHRIRNHHAWNSIKWFCAAICYLILVHGALQTGYITSVLTTIEKRFEIRSKVSGLVISSYEFGSLLSVLFVSYYGSRGHIPNFVGVGSLLLMTGAITWSLPHFVSNPPPLNETLAYVRGRLSDVPGAMPDICVKNTLGAAVLHNVSLAVSPPAECDVADADSKYNPSSYVAILMIGQVLLGIGGSPIFTLGTTYIDNHVSEDESAVYLGAMYVCVALGPVCGFLLGALMLSQYVVPPEPADLPESAFVGLWWAGFVLLGLAYLFAALPFFGFPKRLNQSGCSKVGAPPPPPTVNLTGDSVANNGGVASKPSPTADVSLNTTGGGGGAQSPQSACAYEPTGLTISCEPAAAAAAPGVTPRSTAATTTGGGNAVHFADDDQLIGADDGDEKEATGVRTLPGHIWRLLTNNVYMVSSLGACCDLAIVSGFTTYLPKYLEVQFALSKSKASLLTGSIAVPGAIVGISLGSFLLKRYKPSLSRTAGVMVAFNALALFMLAFFFFFGCANLDLVGKFKPYTRRFDGDLKDLQDLQHLLQKSTVNLSVSCNMDCGCSPDEYQPVCGRDGRTYFSPCFAGCTTVHTQPVAKPSLAGPVFRSRVNYRDCACIPENMTKPARVALGTGWAEALSTDPMGDAELGACVRECAMIVPFFAFLFALTLCASLNQMPLIMVTLRAVTEDQKAFALGLQVVMLRVLAYIPAPIIFGAVIDTTCLLWKVTAEERCDGAPSRTVGTTCLLYDVEQFRLRYGLIALGLKLIAVCLSVLLWRCIWRRDRRHADAFSPPITMGELARRVADMDNLHISPADFGCMPSHAKAGGAAAGMRSCYSDESLFASRKRRREASVSQQQQTQAEGGGGPPASVSNSSSRRERYRGHQKMLSC